MNGYDIADKLSPFVNNSVFNALCRVYSRTSASMQDRYVAFVRGNNYSPTVEDIVDFVEGDAEWAAAVLAEQLGGGR